MRRTVWLAALLLGGLGPSPTRAGGLGALTLRLHNLRFHGTIADHTDNHGADRRIWSEALGRKESLYVYLPPGFDPCRRYPLVLWLHGIIENERIPLIEAVPYFDKAIARGRCPPLIVAIPNGRIPGTFPPDSHFLNTRFGRYEDYLLDDVLPFVEAHYPIRPERAMRFIIGYSLSGWASYAVGLKNTHVFGGVASIMAPLNMRYVDCHGNYGANFNPCCWGLRNDLCRNITIGRWGPIRGTLRRAIEPYFGWGPEGLARLSWENPIEMLDRFDIRPGQVALYIGYIRKDEFNVDAQVESFLWVARRRGLCVHVDYDPVAPTHTVFRCMKFFPLAIDWMARQIASHDSADGCPNVSLP